MPGFAGDYSFWDDWDNDKSWSFTRWHKRSSAEAADARDRARKLDLRRVVDGEEYATPPPFYVRDRLGKVGSEWDAVNLVRDVAGLDTGGTIKGEEEFDREIAQARKDWDFATRNLSHYEFPIEWPQFENEQRAAYAFVQNVDLSKVCVGNTPIERAVAYMAALSRMSGQGNQHGKDSDDNQPQSFQNGGADAGKEAAQKLNEAWDKVSKMSQQERDEFMESEGEDKLPESFGKKKDLSKERKWITKLVGLVAGNSLLKILENISRELNIKSETVLKSTLDFVPVTGGSEIDTRDIEDITQMSLLSAGEYAMLQTLPELGMLRIVNGEAQTIPRGERLVKKQLVCMTVDVSGSMFGNEAWKVALAALMNRWEAASKGDAEVLWSAFASRVSPFKVVKPGGSLKDAKKQFGALVNNDGSLGGGTNIAKALDDSFLEVERRYNQSKNTELPEVMVVTDGLDYGQPRALEAWEAMKRKGTAPRINSFLIAEVYEHGGNMRVNGVSDNALDLVRAHFKGVKNARDYPANDAWAGLIKLAMISGGSVWVVDSSTGEHIPWARILGVKDTAVTNNPYTMGW